MDNILHPKKKDKHSDSSDREPKKARPTSLDMRGSNRSKDRVAGRSPRLAPTCPGKFEVIIESPPLCFHGGSQESTGALLSGRLKLKIEDPTGSVKLQKFNMVLRLAISTVKPISKDCVNCKTRYEEITSWTFLTEPKTFQQDEDNQFPFSHLLKGNLPGTTNATLGALRYQLIATATTSNGELIDITHPLVIKRAVPPGHDKASIRIFPPTHLTGRVVLPSVVHPIGTFPVQMNLSGVVDNKKDSQTRWRLSKLLWRVEETTSMVSVACPKHSHKVADGKALRLPNLTKILGQGELRRGWKTDFDTPAGDIHLEFEAAVSTKVGQKVVCDVNCEAGLEVKHSLFIECIVAEEFIPTKNKSVITPTGAARILRMQFNITVTERPGMGLAWDDEIPPMYEDVPPRPPTYPSGPSETLTETEPAAGEAYDYTGPELEFNDLERLVSVNPSEPPRYRERDPAEVNDTPLLRADDETRNTEPGPSQLGDLGEDVHRPRTGPVYRANDLEIEPPQYALRPRQASGESQLPEEDYGEGETA